MPPQIESADQSTGECNDADAQAQPARQPDRKTGGRQHDDGMERDVGRAGIPRLSMPTICTTATDASSAIVTRVRARSSFSSLSPWCGPDSGGKQVHHLTQSAT
jgi:hypothetical protein